MRRLRALSMAACLLAATPVAAREVLLPLTVEPPILRDEIVRRVFVEPGERSHLFGSPEECSWFVLSEPEVSMEPGRVRIRARGEAQLAAEIGGNCVAPVPWSGIVEILESPRLEGWTLRFDVVDSSLYDPQGNPARLVGPLWDRVKTAIQPHFAPVAVDLGGPFRELREFLPLVAAPENADEVRRVLETLRPIAARATVRGVVIDAALDVADPPLVEGTPTPEPPLDAAEIEAFSEKLDRWDAFLTFVVKSLAAKTISPESRQRLLELLIDARYRVLDALDTPIREPDPVRMLFLRTWSDLAPMASELADALPGGEALRVTTFVAAGDALRAFEAAGASFGVEISADGLRRLARMLDPDETADPLDSVPGIDPSLRDLFGFGIAPPPSPRPPTPTPWAFLGRWLSPGVAHAAEAGGAKDDGWKEWVFRGREDLGPYLGKVGRLLGKVAGTLAASRRFDAATRATFTRLVPATAWQESCWRQFVARAGELTYIRSARGSVGIMQINERVWRGFYGSAELRWDVEYNARAGTEILERYLTMAMKKSPQAAKSAKRLARVTYAAYNGGPAQLERYLDPGRRGPALTRVVDELFGAKFDAPEDAVAKRVGQCLVGGKA